MPMYPPLKRINNFILRAENLSNHCMGGLIQNSTFTMLCPFNLQVLKFGAIVAESEVEFALMHQLPVSKGFPDIGLRLPGGDCPKYQFLLETRL